MGIMAGDACVPLRFYAAMFLHRSTVIPLMTAAAQGFHGSIEHRRVIGTVGTMAFRAVLGGRHMHGALGPVL